MTRVQSGAVERDSMVSLVDAWRGVRSLIEEAPPGESQREWDLAVCAWIARLDPQVGSYANISEWGRAAHPGAIEWSPRAVQGLVAHARGVVLTRLGYRKAQQRGRPVPPTTVRRQASRTGSSVVTRAGEAYVLTPIRGV